MAEDSSQPVQTIKIELERVGDESAPVQPGPVPAGLGPAPAGTPGSPGAVDFRQILAPSSLREVSSILERIRGGFSVGTLDSIGRVMNSTVSRFAGQAAVAGEAVAGSAGEASAALAGSAAAGTGGLVAAAGAAGIALLAVGAIMKAFSVSMAHVTSRMQELGRFDPRIAAANAMATVATMMRQRDQARLESPLLAFASAGKTQLSDTWAPFETAWGNVKSAVAGSMSRHFSMLLAGPSMNLRVFNALTADVGKAIEELRGSGSIVQWVKGAIETPLAKHFPALMAEIAKITGNTAALKSALATQAANANKIMFEEIEKLLNARMPSPVSP